MELITKAALSRRAFFAGAGSVAAAAALAGCSDDGTVTIPVPNTAYSDGDILSFALQTEYIGTEYYLHALTGTGLTASSDIGSTPGAVNAPAGPIAGLTTAQSEFIAQFAQDELGHVRTLRAALAAQGVTVPNRPALDYVAQFAAISAASNGVIPASFNPFASFNNFVLGAFAFEDVDVTAYTGGAPYITATANLIAAAQIQGVEAYHAGALRSVLVHNATSLVTGSTTLTYQAAAQAIQTVRATLTASSTASPFLPLTMNGETPLTTGSATTASTVVNASPTNALAYGRSFGQVLHILYGTTANGATKGGFFPNGLAGNISVTS